MPRDAGRPLRRARPDGDRGGGGGGGSGLFGLLKFLVFALVLAAVVLVVALDGASAAGQRTSCSMSPRTTRPRSRCRSSRTSSGRTSGASLTDPVVGRSDPGRIRGRGRATRRRSIADRLGRGRPPRRQPGVRLHRHRPAADRRRCAIGDYILRRNLTPDQLVTALLDPPVVTYVDISLRTGLRLEQMTAKLQTHDGPRDGPAGVLRPRDHRHPTR